ncbi:RNI-like protein [Suillus hirtellus]|nr:RNI-like protein [Suillus hirtellus]
MASPSSSCSPSSSAVTIPIPGKSILKRPPPTQTGIFSRIKGFLPTQSPAFASDDIKPLKRAHFILPKLVTVYPISSTNPPSTPTLKDEKRAIEEREAERRSRVVRGNSIGPNETEDWWNLDKVESFYRECCASREEEPDPAISAAFKRASGTNPRSVDLSGVQLTPTSAAILSDVFTIEWGLRKLTLRECDLDDYKLKLMLHALLIPGTLVFLSVASNRRLKTPAFKVLGFYASQAKNLQFLDLSQTNLDKKAVDYIVVSLTTAPEPGLISLRLDDCSLRVPALDVLARVVRTSSLRNISLRHNRINATGAVALALMIRDYPDVVPSTPNSSTFPSQGGIISSPPSSPIPPSAHLPPPSPVTRTGPVLPPPRHPSSMPPQTTYTPYVPRSRRGAATTQTPPLSASGQPVPIITSNPQGGVTTRHLAPNVGHQRSEGGFHPNGTAHRHDDGPSAALLDKVRALDALPRLGALRTLDLRGNDLRNGVTYLAQVLKRNRTLKVLNLSENKLDVQCLVAIAEALKYNHCLETLDLSRNPCSGPGLEGIQSLRTAFTLNNALKRLFLSSTAMTSPGAIALAEFLPESNSLLHLDLTDNNLDIAAIMALSSGLKANHTMRCLDINIPPDDEEFAKMCREILNTCIRNTEEAEKAAHVSDGLRSPASNKGFGKGVWNMIQESELAKSIGQGGGLKGNDEVISRAYTLLSQVENSVNSPRSFSVASSGVSSSTAVSSADQDLVQQAKAIVDAITEKVQTTTDIVLLEELLGLCDKLNSAITQLSSAPSNISLLHGLGLNIPNAEISPANGDASHGNPADLSEDDTPLTPKVDKGKGRAEPEPEEPEKVLSPTFMITESEDEDEDDNRLLGEEDQISVPSPVVRSKSWVEEEGEIFRKGAVLLGPEEMEGEYAGEDLRRELLEAMVERPPPRGIIDEFGMDLDVIVPEIASPPPGEALRPPPRPYISRTRSTSSNGSMGDLHSPNSPTTMTAARSPMSPTFPASRPFPGGFSASPPPEPR